MKVTPLGCTVFGVFGQVIISLFSYLYFSTWVYWISNGYMANIQRSNIHLGLCIFALVFITYSFLMGCHICYVIHHDFDNIRAYFWTRIHLFILVVAFSVLSLVEMSMYLEISNTQLSQLLKEIVEDSSFQADSASALIFPDWMEKWQKTYSCCGIVSFKDYAEYGDRKSVSPSCCRWKSDSVDEEGWKCGDGVLRMNHAFLEEKIHTKGCGADMKASLIKLSIYGCILSGISTVFIVISSLCYLTYLQQYSQEQHSSRMKRYDNEEREQLKLLSKKRQQQQLLRSPSNKGPAKAHGTKVASTSHQSRSRSRSTSSKSHNKTHISAQLENVEYQCEEKTYIKNINNKSLKKGSVKSKSCPDNLPNQGSSANANARLKKEKREALVSTRSLPRQKRSKSRSGSSHPVKKETTVDVHEDYRDYKENRQFPAFKTNENLFVNLIGAASSRRTSKNVSNTSSIDFQEDVLVPRLLIRKSKQVIFDQNSNVYYDRENEFSDDVSAEFDEDQQNANLPENTNLEIKFTEDDDDDDYDPGDVIVRQL